MMGNLLRAYCALSVSYLPSTYYMGMLVALIVLVGFMYIVGMRRMMHYTLLLLTVEYIFLIFGSFVIFRTSIVSCGYSLIPFQSYLSCHSYHEELMAQIILNTLVFIPMGLLLGSVFTKSMTWTRILLLGITFSANIEVLQFIFRKGFAEFDDIMHNTLGCLIGYVLVCSKKILLENKTISKP